MRLGKLRVESATRRPRKNPSRPVSGRTRGELHQKREMLAQQLRPLPFLTSFLRVDWTGAGRGSRTPKTRRSADFECDAVLMQAPVLQHFLRLAFGAVARLVQFGVVLCGPVAHTLRTPRNPDHGDPGTPELYCVKSRTRWCDTQEVRIGLGDRSLADRKFHRLAMRSTRLASAASSFPTSPSDDTFGFSSKTRSTREERP
jgi:hypothetical protein